MKEKVLFIGHLDFDELFAQVKFNLQQYTVNNGVRPDFIEMPTDLIDMYLKKLNASESHNRNELYCMGIKVREIKQP